jgi:hypothetical protein
MISNLMWGSWGFYKVLIGFTVFYWCLSFMVVILMGLTMEEAHSRNKIFEAINFSINFSIGYSLIAEEFLAVNLKPVIKIVKEDVLKEKKIVDEYVLKEKLARSAYALARSKKNSSSQIELDEYSKKNDISKSVAFNEAYIKLMAKMTRLICLNVVTILFIPITIFRDCIYSSKSNDFMPTFTYLIERSLPDFEHELN